MSYHFYYSQFKGNIAFSPTEQNFIIDNNLYYHCIHKVITRVYNFIIVAMIKSKYLTLNCEK